MDCRVGCTCCVKFLDGDVVVEWVGPPFEEESVSCNDDDEDDEDDDEVE